MTRRCAVLAVLAVACASAAAPRVAYADDRAAAQQLFQQGKQLMRAGDFVQACPKFEAAEQLSSTPGVRLNLADCWVKLGRLASAWGKYDDALVMAERSGDRAAAELARKGRAALEPKLMYLTVTMAPDAMVPGLELKRDGEKMLPAALGTPIPVDPGAHEIVAEAPGRVRWSTTQTVSGAGTKATVVVPMLAVDIALAPKADTPVVVTGPGGGVTDANPSRPGATQRTLGWVSGGLGVVGLGVGAGFLIDALSEKSDYRAHLTAAGQCADATCQTDSHAAYTAGTVATVGFIAGGTLLATGVVLLVTAPSRPRQVTARFIPMLTPRAGGFGVVGDW